MRAACRYINSLHINQYVTERCIIEPEGYPQAKFIRTVPTVRYTPHLYGTMKASRWSEEHICIPGFQTCGKNYGILGALFMPLSYERVSALDWIQQYAVHGCYSTALALGIVENRTPPCLWHSLREAETLIHPLVCSPPLGAATPTGRWNTEGMSISFRFPNALCIASYCQFLLVFETH
jgi:hypothetical protein